MSFIPFMEGGGGRKDMALRQERQKQHRIDQGLGQINAIFGGGSYPIYTRATEFDPAAKYFDLMPNGRYSAYETPMKEGKRPPIHDIGDIFSGLGKKPPQVVDRRAQMKDFKHGLYTQGQSQEFTGFGDAFFNQRAQDYRNYAMPQLSQQYRQANDSLNYGFQNRGLAGSSAAKQGQSNLNLEMGRQQQNIVDTGQSQANALRAQVENARLQAIQQLYMSADPGQASLTALNSASGFQAPNAFQPVANAFSNIANQYAIGQILQNNPNNQPLQYGNPNAAAIPQQ